MTARGASCRPARPGSHSRKHRRWPGPAQEDLRRPRPVEARGQGQHGVIGAAELRGGQNGRVECRVLGRELDVELGQTQWPVAVAIGPPLVELAVQGQQGTGDPGSHGGWSRGAEPRQHDEIMEILDRRRRPGQQAGDLLQGGRIVVLDHGQGTGELAIEIGVPRRKRGAEGRAERRLGRRRARAGRGPEWVTAGGVALPDRAQELRRGQVAECELHGPHRVQARPGIHSRVADQAQGTRQGGGRVGRCAPQGKGCPLRGGLCPARPAPSARRVEIGDEVGRRPADRPVGVTPVRQNGRLHITRTRACRGGAGWRSERRSRAGSSPAVAASSRSPRRPSRHSSGRGWTASRASSVSGTETGLSPPTYRTR